MTQDRQIDLQDQIKNALVEKRALRIEGNNSKAFLGRETAGERLSVSQHQGIINYEPTELVLTARAGTLLSEIEQALDEKGQMLTFEPPHFGDKATLGGTIACGLSGARRPYAGAARDAVLGTRILNGKAEILRFGGEVIKNVAGYDVSRLMVGAYGTLGVLLDISLKVVPKPAVNLTLMQECDAQQAIEKMNRWRSQSLPVSGLSHLQQTLYIRLSGTEQTVQAGRARLGGEVWGNDAALWRSIGEHQHDFFSGNETLWRLAVDSKTSALNEPCLIDWAGGVRWVRGGTATQRQTWVDYHGGHAMLFRGKSEDGEVFQPLSAGLLPLHQNLKTAFDPTGILNPQRMFAAC